MKTLGPNQQKLVNALKNGQYKQLFGSMKKDGAFCFLGVAVDMHPSAKWQATGCGYEYAWYLSGPQDNVERVKTHYCFKSKGSVMSLVYKNDDGMKFSELAQELETNPDKYFDQAI